MSARRDRLKKLVKVQQQLTALHQTRHAGLVAAAAHADAEVKELIEHFDTPGSLSGLFPDLYHSRIDAAFARRDESIEAAREEAALVARATARTNMVERAYRTVRSEQDRQKSDRERLEMIEQKSKRR